MMNKKIGYIVVLVVIVAGFWAGFYYKDAILGLYKGAAKHLEEFKATDLGKSVDQITQRMLVPGPLNIGGQANNAVLSKAKIIAQTNIQRFNNGSLPPLIENTRLNDAAWAKANDMFNNQYFEHVSPSGVDPGTLIKKFRYEYIVSGENLILGNFRDEAELVQDWMNSPGHRANILNDRFVDIGVAIVKGTYKGETVWIGVQEFGLPLSACQSPNNAMKMEIETNKLALDQLAAEIEAKRAQINNTNRNSPQYNELVDQYNAMVAQYNELNQTTRNIIVQFNAQVDNFNRCVAGT